MSKTAVTLTTTITVDTAEFWSSVCGSAWETWDWWQKYEYSPCSNWAVPGELTVWVDNPDEEGGKPIKKTLDVNDLAEAYSKYSAGCRVNWQDLDACDGDAIMQTAVFGEVVYG